MTAKKAPKLFDVQYIPVADIDPDPDQPRKELKGIDELAASIKAFGVRAPIYVRKTGERYKLMDGERRWTAATRAKLTEIPAYVATNDDAEVVLLQMVDNQHQELTPEEKSQGTQRAFAFNRTTEEIAAATGYSKDAIDKARIGYKASRAFYGDDYEPTTIDRFIAIAEFKDDAEAVERLEKAPEASITAVTAELRREKKLAELVKDAESVVRKAGCKLIGTVDHSKHQYLGSEDTPPEGAKYAHVYGYSHATTVTIKWYTDADTTVDVEAQKDAEEADRIAAELEAAHTRRREFVFEHLRGNGHVVRHDTLRALAEATWGDNGTANASVLDGHLFDGVQGFVPRIVASIVAAIDRKAALALEDDYYGNYYRDITLAYFTALEAIGFEPTEVEKAALMALPKDEPECGDAA